MKHENVQQQQQHLYFFVLFNFSIRPIWLHLKQWIERTRTKTIVFRNTGLFQILPVEPFNLYKKNHDYHLNDDPNRQRYRHDIHRFKQGTTSIPAFQYNHSYCSISTEKKNHSKRSVFFVLIVSICTINSCCSSLRLMCDACNLLLSIRPRRCYRQQFQTKHTKMCNLIEFYLWPNIIFFCWFHVLFVRWKQNIRKFSNNGVQFNAFKAPLSLNIDTFLDYDSEEMFYVKRFE